MKKRTCRLTGMGCLMVFSLFRSMAQDIHFSQYLQAPLLANPGNAGMMNGEHRADFNYRTQWAAVGTPYKTMDVSYDTHVFKAKEHKGSYLGMGLNVFKDKAGDSQMSQLQANGTVSGILCMSQYNTLSLGLQGGFVQRSVNFENLRWGNQFDGKNYNSNIASTETSGLSSFTYADVSTGLLWQHRREQATFATGNAISSFDIGIAAHHLNRPALKYNGYNENLKMRLVAHANAEFDINNTPICLVPSFIYMRQGSLQELLLGALVKYKIDQRSSKYTGFGKNSAVYFGTQLRVKDAIIPMIMYQMEYYSFGLSYDINTSSLHKSSNYRGGMEISFSYLFARKLNR